VTGGFFVRGDALQHRSKSAIFSMLSEIPNRTGVDLEACYHLGSLHAAGDKGGHRWDSV
jgi:hypothetical protein